MRVNIPFVPIAVVVRFERRALGPRWSQFTVRQFMLATALLALVMTCYITRVALPARRLRYQQADQTVREHLALLARAATEDRKQERNTREWADRIVQFAEKERREAANWPPASEKRAYHQGLASAWDKALQRVPVGRGEELGKRGRLIEKHRKTLIETRKSVENDLERLERLAGQITRLPNSLEWEMLQVGPTLVQIKQRMQDENRAKAVQAMLGTKTPMNPPGATGAMTAK